MLSTRRFISSTSSLVSNRLSSSLRFDYRSGCEATTFLAPPTNDCADTPLSILWSTVSYLESTAFHNNPHTISHHLHALLFTSRRQLSTTRKPSTNDAKKQAIDRNKLITDLKKDNSANKLLQMIEEEGEQFTCVNIRTCWSSLASMRAHHNIIKQDPRFKTFMADTGRLILDDQSDLNDARSLANIIYSIAKVGLTALDDEPKEYLRV